MFYDRFIKLCNDKKITPAQVARDLDINKSTISMWKSDGTTPKSKTLNKIAEYFGVSASDLLYDGTVRITPLDPARVAAQKRLNQFDLSRKTSRFSEIVRQMKIEENSENLQALKDEANAIKNELKAYYLDSKELDGEGAFVELGNRLLAIVLKVYPEFAEFDLLSEQGKRDVLDYIKFRVEREQERGADPE